jgi:hypothetical protein
MRFEAYDPTDRRKGDSTLTAFDVSPKTMNIDKGQTKSLFITFSPVPGREGVYSGVLKIKSGRRSFVMMLRGEAYLPQVEEGKNDPSQIIANSCGITSSALLYNANKVGANEGATSIYPTGPGTISSSNAAVKINTSTTKAIDSDLDTWVNPGCKPHREDDSETRRPRVQLCESTTLLPVTMSGVESQANDSLQMRQEKMDKCLQKTTGTLQESLHKKKPHRKSWRCDDSDTHAVESFTDKDINQSESMHGARNTNAAQTRNASSACNRSSTYSFTQTKTHLARAKYFLERKDHMDSVSFHTYNNRSASSSLHNGIGMQSFIGYSTSASAGAALFKTISDKRKTSTTFNSNGDTKMRQKNSSYSRKSSGTLVNSRRGIYFKKGQVDFGSVGVGSLHRLKIELCNPTDKEVTVHISDPSLPFVLLHNEVKLRPKCFVRVPLRFVPVSGPQEYACELHAKSADGKFSALTLLSGMSF